MPRRYAYQAMAAQPDEAREATRLESRRRRSGARTSRTRRLTKRAVQKADGRYLIYYEKA